MVGKRLKELRMEKGLSQQELGIAIGVTKVSICGYENGTRLPNLEKLIKLADILEEIYLKDENKRSLGELSDLLVNVKDDIKEYDTIREILIKCDMFDDSDIEY